MKRGWEIKKLGDVCALQNGFPFRSKLFKPSGVPVLRISSIQNDSICDKTLVFVDPSDYKEKLDKYKVVDGDLLIAMSGATTGKVGFNQTGLTFLLNQRVGKFEPSEHLEKRYLYFYLCTKVQENLEISAGAAQPNLRTHQIKEFQIPLPPLEEQKRIVSVLDEAFEGLNRARENAEANLESARELFERFCSNLFSRSGLGWVQCTIGDVITLQRGKDITKKDQRKGAVPVVSSGGVKSYHDTAYAKGPGVIVGRKGSIGSVHFVSEDYWPHDTTLWVCNFKGNEPKLVYFLLRGLALTDLDTGTANPSLKRSLVHPISISWPTFNLQQNVVKELSDCSDKTLELKAHYISKLRDISDLRQSLLQKAFAGALK